MRASFLLVLPLAALIAGCNTSYNYFQEEEDPAQQGDGSVFGRILGLADNKPKPEVPDAPRAPLAMPPSTNLPPPESTEVAVPEGVDWPDDPDEAERRRQIAKAKKGEENPGFEENLWDTKHARLSPEEIQAGRLEGGGQDGGEQDRREWLSSTGNQTFRLSPRELAKTFRKPDPASEVLTADGKAAPRQYLIQPPDEYREPADTAPLPDPGDVEQSDWAKKRLYKLNDRRPPRAQQ